MAVLPTTDISSIVHSQHHSDMQHNRGAYPITGIILAGGESRRMGKDKAFLEMGESCIVRSLYCQLISVCKQVMIVTNSRKASLFTTIPVVVDQRQNQGPLMGVYSGLIASSSEINIITACDIPYIEPTLFPLLLAHFDNKEIVIPTFPTKGDMPLLGVYKKQVSRVAHELLRNNKRRMVHLLDRCAAHRVYIENESWYFNLNTPGEYEQYLRNKMSA